MIYKFNQSGAWVKGQGHEPQQFIYTYILSIIGSSPNILYRRKLKTNLTPSTLKVGFLARPTNIVNMFIVILAKLMLTTMGYMRK
jgi:hypothetical protein